MKTVFLVDDDNALRTALSRLLGVCGYNVRAYASAEEFLDEFDPEQPGCLLLDLRMPGRSGLELQSELALRGSLMPVIFLSGHADIPTSVYAMKQGAIDFLQKPVREGELTAAIERALERDAEARKEHRELAELRQRFDSLTPRERDVMAEMISGQRNKQAATSLGIAERTVKLHRSRVFEKMGAPSLADLVRMAQRLGL